MHQKPAKRMMSDEIHRILYCYMSKVGCTAIKTLIATANAIHLNVTPPSPYKIHYEGETGKVGFAKISTSRLTDEQIQYRIDNYFTFMITRHPMERLLSAYRDKVTIHAHTTPIRVSHFRVPVLQHVRPQLFSAVPNTSQSERERFLDDLGKQHQPSFEEFVQWIVEKQIVNEHWLSAVNSCHPCAHNWSAIMRLESMVSDQELLLERLGKDAPENVRRIHPTANQSSFFPSLHLGEWKNIPDDHEDYILQLYRQDMELFGYHWDKERKTTDCYIPTADGVCC